MRLAALAFMLFLLSFGIGLAIFPKIQPACANSISCKSPLTQKIENGATGIFMGREVPVPTIDTLADTTVPNVLGVNIAEGEKHIYVDLEAQTLYAYQGDTQVMKARVSTGRWGRTPVGNYNIYLKLRATRMSGGSGADYYNLPNVPWTMYYSGDYGLHGAYWHNNFGYTMSHGCVNMRQIDARDLFAWADGPENREKGTPVHICYSFTEPNNCIQHKNL